MGTFPKYANRAVEIATDRLAVNDHLIDKKGRDKADYHQLLLLKFWLADKEFPDHGNSDRRRWGSKAIWNQAKSYRKELKRAPDLDRYDLLEEDDRHAPSFEKLMEQRQVLQKLERHLELPEIQLIATYVAHGGYSMSVWTAYDRPCSYRYFCRKLKELRLKCQDFIREICPEMVPKNGPLAL